MLAFFRPYSPEFVGWFRDFGQSTANYDANGHYARISPAFNAFSYDQATTRSTAARQPAHAGLPNGGVPGLHAGAAVPRCPGAATPAGRGRQRAVARRDGNLDCDPAIVPPGP